MTNYACKMFRLKNQKIYNVLIKKKLKLRCIATKIDFKEGD